MDEIDVQSSKVERNWAMMTHLSAFAFLILPGIGQILGPLIVWAIKKDDMPFVREQGREALNFNISITLFYLMCVPLYFIVIGIPLAIAIAIYHILFIIIGGIQAGDGKHFKYPFAIRLLK